MAARRTATAWVLAGSTLLGLGGLSSCAAQAPAAPAKPPHSVQPLVPQNGGDALARLQAEIGTAPCTADQQCRTLPVGSKSCGGPERWLAWSTQTSRLETLQALSGAAGAGQPPQQPRPGGMSNCAYNADPGAICQSQRCVLRAPNSLS